MLVVILILRLQKPAKTDDEDEPGDEPEKPNSDFQTGAESRSGWEADYDYDLDLD
jgi:hypothetical protein